MNHHNRNNTALYALILMLCAAWLCAFAANNSPLPTRSQITKAMNTHRDANPSCYVCGASKSLFRQSCYVRYKENVTRHSINGTNSTARQLLDAVHLELVAKNLPVHHIKSQKPFPELAADPNNLMTLCWTCHFWLGHLKGHYKDHEANLIVVIDSVKMAVSSNSVSFKSLQE